MELRLPLEMSPGREAACRAVFGTWGFLRTMHGKLPLRVDFIYRLQFGEVSGHRVLIKRGPGSRGHTECGTTHEATSGMSSLDRPHPEVRPEGREPLPDKAGESSLLSRSGGEKGLRGGGAGKPQCSSRGRPGFRGTLWVASRVPSALSTS